jgi:hypothetical protein
MDEQGSIINKFYDINFKEKTISVQKKHFASTFYILKDGRVIVVTNGSGYIYQGVNQDGRFIVGVSKMPKPSFTKTLPFETIYLNDTCLMYDDVEYVQVPQMDYTNKHYRNLWTELKEYGEYINKIFPLLLEDKDRYYVEVNNHKLGNTKRDYFSFRPYYAIKQVVELSNNQLLFSVFNGGSSKSDLPNKNTPYYFFIIDIATGEVIKDVSPNDTSVYKNNIPYIIGEDRVNQRLIYKTHDRLYFMNLQGEITVTINLLDKKYSAFRDWSLLGVQASKVFFFDHNKSYVYSFYIGETTLDVNKAILDAIAFSKSITN